MPECAPTSLSQHNKLLERTLLWLGRQWPSGKPASRGVGRLSLAGYLQVWWRVVMR